MRRKLLLNYLYTCALSILIRSTSCSTQTAALIASSPGTQGSNNGERTLELKQNEPPMSDDANQREQRRQVIGEQAREAVQPIRRKRELGYAAGPAQFQVMSNPSGGQRLKKSNHPMERISRKLVSKKNNARSNVIGLIGIQEDQDKRDVHKLQGVASRAFLSTGQDERKFEQREAKRSSHSGGAVKVANSKSREIKESDPAPQSSLSKENLKVHDDRKYAALKGDNDLEKSVSENEQLENEAGFDDKSSEYDETGDDDMEALSRDTAYKESNPEVSDVLEDRAGNLAQKAAEDDDFEGQDTVKREADVPEEEYDDVEREDDTCNNDNLIDENWSKIRSGPGLFDKTEKHDSRVKRQDARAGEDEATDLEDAPKQEIEGVQQDEKFEDDSNANSKDQITRTAINESLKSNRMANLKRQTALENLARTEVDDEAEAEIKSMNGESNESSKQEFSNDNAEKINIDGRSQVDLDKETNGRDDDKKERIMANIDEDGKSSKQVSTLDETSKYDKSYSDYEKRVEQQIQQRIDSIKEEIKREVEEKQKVREIEINNAKYDKMQNEIEEEVDENNQGLDIPSERKSVSKRSTVDGIHNPGPKNKRRILRKVKRSETTNARQLQAIEGVEKLDPDVLRKARLCHESIRKRSAPIYGAADEEVPDLSKPLIRRSNPRNVYLVSNDLKMSPSPETRDISKNITIPIPEQAHASILDAVPPGIPLNPTLSEDFSSQARDKAKRNLGQFFRRRRASAVIPEERVAFIAYRSQDDDENDEGSEFDDEGFEDRTSNLQQDKFYAVPQSSMPEDENTANFLFDGIDRDRSDFLVRHKRAGIRNNEIARIRGGGALARRQARTRAKKMQTAKMTSRKNDMNRDKRQSRNVRQDSNSDSVVSLVGSSQELSPRLATEYKEAFGGLQSDPSGALARFKRVKRRVHLGLPD